MNTGMSSPLHGRFLLVLALAVLLMASEAATGCLRRMRRTGSARRENVP